MLLCDDLPAWMFHVFMFLFAFWNLILFQRVNLIFCFLCFVMIFGFAIENHAKTGLGVFFTSG